MKTISVEHARRIALAAQGFADPRPAAVTRAHIRKAIRRQRLLQIDSVNVLTRAHTMPLFSRLGAYDRDLLDRMAYRDRELFEYWGHEASLIDIRLFPLFRFRMRPHEHPRMQAWIARNQELIAVVRREVADRGPIGIADLKDRAERSSSWWGWSDEKMALEHLFKTGEITAAGRRNFERLYDLVERVIPADLLEQVVPSHEAYRRLLLHGAEALGIGTASDICDYFRLHKPSARPIVASLADEGALVPLRVDGWRDLAYLHPGAKQPRSVRARALLSPFDPLVWERARTERLFSFNYRIEIYTPEPKRIYGYYVLPFLLGEQIVARADLKADRSAGLLRVQSAWVEQVAPDHDLVAAELLAELHEMAAWLGLSGVVVERKGTLARALRLAASGLGGRGRRPARKA